MKKEYIALLVVLAAGFLVRMWGITWGLPLKKGHIDESVVIFYSMRFLTGDLNPQVFFDYPTLFLYLLALLFLGYFLSGRLFGLFASLDDFAGMFLFRDASTLYIIARFLTVIFAIGSIYTVYRISKENFSFALLPSLILALAPMHVLHSHYATVDVACVFFILVSVLYLMRYYNSGLKVHLNVGAFLMGLAVSVKYYPIIFVLPILYAIYLKERANALKRSFGVIFLLLFGFIAGSPYAVFNVQAFASRFMNRFQLIVWSGVSGGNVSLIKPWLFIKDSLTLTPALIILLGILLLIHSMIQKKEDAKKVLLFSSFPVLYIVFLSSWKIFSPHYILPVLPFIAILGAHGLNRLPLSRYKNMINLAVIIIVITPMLRHTIKTDMLLATEDTRIQAYHWIKQTLPAGSRILRLPFTPEFSQKDPYLVHVDWEGQMIGTPVQEIVRKYDFIIMSHFNNTEVTPWERILQEQYTLTKEWAHKLLAPFHHPRILIYGKKA